jgi:manganese/zinc/iron transport system substrate-binding protein
VGDITWTLVVLGFVRLAAFYSHRGGAGETMRASILTQPGRSPRILISQKVTAARRKTCFNAQPNLNRNNMLRHVTTASVLLALVTLIPGCTNAPTARKDTLDVVCTTGPVADMLRNLGGKRLNVIGLMGPGVDPHLYRASSSDIERVHDADMIFYNGLHLEGRMADMFEKMERRKPTFAVTQGLVEENNPNLRKPPEFEGYYDPHVWHDPRLWAECVKYVAAVLAEQDPSHGELYEKNAEAYLKQLEEADAYCREKLVSIPGDQRALVTMHDAFNYFCSAYDLESMPLKGVSTEDEVTIAREAEVVDFLVKNKVKAVFVESAARPQNIETIVAECRKAGHEVRLGPDGGGEFVLYADALGPAGSGADTYLGMIKANVDTIVAGLK